MVNSGFAASRRTRPTASTSWNCASATLFTCTKRETTAGTRELCTAQAKRDYFLPHLLKVAKKKKTPSRKRVFKFLVPSFISQKSPFFLETQSKSLEITSFYDELFSKKKNNSVQFSAFEKIQSSPSQVVVCSLLEAACMLEGTGMFTLSFTIFFSPYIIHYDVQLVAER